MNVEHGKDEETKGLNTSDLADIMQEMLRLDEDIETEQELFWIVGLDARHSILCIENIEFDSIEDAVADPMEVLSLALQKRAASIILVRSHAGGEPAATPEDEDMTDRLIQAAKVVNVRVLDLLIISKDAYFSFSEHGLMAALAQSTKYEPNYATIDRIAKQAKEMGRTEGQVAMAARMKQDGAEIELIVRYTGLSREDIEAL